MLLLETLADAQGDSCNALGIVKGKALNNSVAKTPKEETGETLCKTMADVKPKPQV